MAPVDVAWLRMDRPTNLMVTMAVVLFATPIDRARFEQMIEARLLRYRRFRQRPVLTFAGAWWSPDPHFDLNRHVRRVRLPKPGQRAELEGFVAELASRPLDPCHPLWQVHVVEDYGDGTAMVVRIHHAVADGMALIRVLLSLTAESLNESGPETAPIASRRGEAGFCELARRTVSEPATRGLSLARSLFSIVTDPGHLLDCARHVPAIGGELAKLAFMPPDSPTRFKGKLSGDKRVAWADPVGLTEVKAVGSVLGCSVNSLLLAVVAGALRSYLAENGDDPAGVEVRAVVPVDLRGEKIGGEELGNHFGVVAIELPLGPESPIAGLCKVRRRMEELKRSHEPAVTLGLLGLLGFAPGVVQDQVFDLLLSRVTAVVTNIPGPQRPLHLAGARIEQLMFWVPQPGDIGMGFSILSLNGRIQVGLMTDAALVPNPAAIAGRIRTEFDRFLYFVLMEPWDGPSLLSSGVI